MRYENIPTQSRYYNFAKTNLRFAKIDFQKCINILLANEKDRM